MQIKNCRRLNELLNLSWRDVSFIVSQKVHHFGNIAPPSDASDIGSSGCESRRRNASANHGRQ